MRLNILFGGEAGQEPNALTQLLGEALVKQGYYVFYSRDYQSLIRGGHNFNVLTFSDEPVYSNDSKIDVLVALDEKTKKIHSKELKKNSTILDGKHENMYFAGRLFKIFCMEFKWLDERLKNLGKKYNENLKEAKQGYDEEKKEHCNIFPRKDHKGNFMNGSQGIAEGAINSGLDVYYAYPMTPATPLLGELAKEQIEKNILVLELESEISVINSAIGSAITGAKAMVGTSGGGFDLMTEALSATGMAEVPLIIYLAQRHGPGTGVPTYTSQGDLNIARHSGHGEFQRVVLAPGDPKECQELISQAFYFSQKFKIPVIVVGDKHLAESAYTLIEKPKITKSEKTISLIRFNTYEKDEKGSATENSEIIKKNFERRLEKQEEIKKEAKKFEQYKIYGNRNSKNIVVSWGSTKGAILDAIAPCSLETRDGLKKSSKGVIIDTIKNLDCEFLQILYIEPFPEIKKELEGKNIILIENNSTALLGNLIAEKTGIFIDNKNKILRYDGRPFLRDELREEIRRRMVR